MVKDHSREHMQGGPVRRAIRIGATILLSFSLLAVLTGCAGAPAGPSPATSRAGADAVAAAATVVHPAYSDPGQRTFVFTAELRSYDDPGIRNTLGTLELRLTQAIGDPNVFEALSAAHLLALDEPYVRGAVVENGITVLGYEDPDERAADVVFRLATTIPATLAARMLDDPGEFTAVFSTAAGPAVAGQLKLGPPSQPRIGSQ
jgi:hypothetical protein